MSFAAHLHSPAPPIERTHLADLWHVRIARAAILE
jgi:hypothetical protein